MKTLFYTFLFVWCVNAVAQQCGTDHIANDIYRFDPQARRAKAELEEFTKQFTARYYADKSSIKKGGRATKFIVPVVFHILHDGGAENYSDKEVGETVEIINEYYNMGNTAELSTVVNEFKNKIGKIEVEFRLARKSPSGKATNGINHYYTTATNVGLENSKINNWPRDKYLNIWVVKAVKMDATKFGTLAYSMYPSSVKDIINNVTGDGVITKVLPTRKTTNGAGVLAHEIGHYLNLSHTWGSTNEPGVSCGDDEVDDTPETMGTQGGCDLGMNICHQGVIENTQNIMNYSNCSIMFTEGQKVRMIAALNSPIADRNKLWTPENLLETGVEPPSSLDCAPIAEFGTPNRLICVGKPITFYNYTYNTPVYTSEWTFDTKESIPTSTEINPSVTYNTPGWKSITLTTTNQFGSSTITKMMVYVTDVKEAIATPFFESFEQYDALNRWTAVNYNLNKTEFAQVNIGRSSQKSLRLDHFYSKFDGDKDELISPAFDLTPIADLSYNLSFDYTYASFNIANIDTNGAGLTIYMANDCDNNWIKVYNIKEWKLIQGRNDAFYVPSQNESWNKVSIDLNKINAAKNMKKNNTRFKFEMVGLVGANNFYIDNINIGKAAVNYSAGVEDVFSHSELIHLYENPVVDDVLKFSISSDVDNATYVIYDICGSKVMDGSIKNNMNILSLSDLKSGNFILKVNTELGQDIVRFVKN